MGCILSVWRSVVILTNSSYLADYGGAYFVTTGRLSVCSSSSNESASVMLDLRRAWTEYEPAVRIRHYLPALLYTCCFALYYVLQRSGFVKKSSRTSLFGHVARPDPDTWWCPAHDGKYPWKQKTKWPIGRKPRGPRNHLQEDATVSTEIWCHQEPRWSTCATVRATPMTTMMTHYRYNL